MTTIMITGAGRGIGQALALKALDQGFRVIGTARAQAALDALSDRDGFVPVIFDVTDGEAIQAASENIDEPIDILVNNSGVIGPARQSTLDMDFQGFAYTLAVNTLGPLRVVQAFLPQLRRAEHPRIATISSGMGRMSYASSDRIAYRASKSAVNKVMQGLATDLGPSGFVVLTINPGWVRTDMGGPSADIGVTESASGILEILKHAKASQNGTFLNWDGSPSSW